MAELQSRLSTSVAELGYFYADQTVCPAPADRNKIYKSWTCDEYFEFQTVKDGYVTVAYTAKSVQLLVFSVLMIVLVKDKIRGTGQIGKLPIFVVFLAVVNSVFAIIRVNALFPRDNHADLNLMAGAFCVEAICF